MVSRIEKLKYIHASLSIDDVKISRGSWWGSRFFARWGLRSLSKEERMFRLTLIGFFVKAGKNLRDFENNLAVTDPYESLKVAREIVAWGDSYVNLIFGEVDSFIKNQDNSKQDEFDVGKGGSFDVSSKEPPDETSKEPPDVTHKEKQPQNGSKKKKNVTTPSKKAPEEPILDNSVRKYIETIYNDCNWGDKLFELLLEVSDKPQIISEHQGKIRVTLVKARKLLGILDNKSIPNSEKIQLKSDIFDRYIRLLSIANNLTGSNKNSFEEIYNVIKNAVKAVKNEQASVSNDIEKFSHNVLTRWLRKQILSKSDSLVDQTRVKAIDHIKSAADKINPLLNMLENKDKSIEEILDNFRDINTLLIKSLSNLRSFINNYYYLFSRDKEKKINITERRTLIRDISDLVNSLQVYAK